jgi:hypothetical protein
MTIRASLQTFGDRPLASERAREGFCDQRVDFPQGDGGDQRGLRGVPILPDTRLLLDVSLIKAMLDGPDAARSSR